MVNRVQRAARSMLVDAIRLEVRHGNVSLTSEMIGYYLSSLEKTERYSNAEQKESGVPKRRVLSPEVLQGLISDKAV